MVHVAVVAGAAALAFPGRQVDTGPSAQLGVAQAARARGLANFALASGGP